MTYTLQQNGVLALSKKSNTTNNCMHVENDGTVVFLGDATVWDDLRIPLYSNKHYTIINMVSLNIFQ